jgi:hypothetical protein
MVHTEHMPMYTQLIHNNEPVALHWSWFHVNACVTAWNQEDPLVHVLSEREHTYREDHTFTDETDGEVFTIHAGDTFRWWRE